MLNPLINMASGADKRRYPRLHARNLSAHLVVTDRSAPCVVQNVSAGGLCIETPDVLPVSMPVAVNLARPGWLDVLKLTGRVVWSLAEKTAKRKGVFPGMRIKFDPMESHSAERLMDLLNELGAPRGSPTPPRRDSVGAKDDAPPVPTTFPTTFPLVREPNLSPPDAPKRGAGPIIGLSETRPRLPSKDDRPDDATLPARVGDLAEVFGKAVEKSVVDKSPQLVVQVQGLLQQMSDLQQRLDNRERELRQAQADLLKKEKQLEKTDRELKAAELAIQRLSMQLSARR